MKACKDIKCRRSGQKLRLSEFPVNRRSEDGHYIYCLDCCRRRSRETRRAKGARERTFREQGIDIDRKPMVQSMMAFSQVHDAINKGCKTREEIQQATKLNYDLIGDALAELWEVKGIKLERLSSGEKVWQVAA